MPGSGKTYSARIVQNALEKRGLSVTNVPWRPRRHLARYSFAGFFALCFPCSALRLGFTVLRSRQRNWQDLLPVTVNILSKLGFILWNKDRLLVLDEGIIHATWSVSARARAVPEEFWSVLGYLLARCRIQLRAVFVDVDIDVVRDRLLQKVASGGGLRHRLVVNGRVDGDELNSARDAYEDVLRYWRPRVRGSVRLNNNVDEPETPREVLDVVIDWIEEAMARNEQ
jgi:hypothetical protein